jgi:hypothetical protein
VLDFLVSSTPNGEPVTAGSTTVLSKAAVRLVARCCSSPARASSGPLLGTHELSTVIVVDPLVVEGEAHASEETGVLRRAAWFRRARPTSEVGELEGG